MNKISKEIKNRRKNKSYFEMLPYWLKTKVNDNVYQLMVYPSAWGRLVITYRNASNIQDHLCSVTVEPENNPIKIEDTAGCFNEGCGNERTFPKACKLLLEYVEKNILNGSFYQIVKEKKI